MVGELWAGVDVEVGREVEIGRGEGEVVGYLTKGEEEFLSFREEEEGSDDSLPLAFRLLFDLP